MTLFYRLTLWIIVCSLIAAQVLGFSYLLRRYASQYLPYVDVLSRAIALTLTIPLVAIQLHALKYTPVLPKRIDPPLEFLAFVALPVAVIGGIFLLVQHLLQQPLKQSTENLLTSDEQINEEGSQFETASMPRWRLSKTLRIQVEDHYLRIFSETGNFYIRGKMSEAIGLLQPHEGVQVHRSHWIAFEYIKELVKEGRDYRLRLHDGGSVPVSRGRLRNVRKMLGKYKVYD